ncbi:MAG TPA: cell division protein ZipA C-terminal FtsZ-binding domain-containing protein [Burkholderiaceae bacterium]|nr:cell division protein ZipA C-terminal FtsZ-binding domain-containing protein [Burkholderiaceae bacterium]
MNQLHWVLLAIAAVLLVALYFYGKWQERKSAGLDEPHGDLDAAPLESPLPTRLASARSARQAPARIEPTMGIAADSALTTGAPSSEGPPSEMPAVGGWMEDALLDVMLELRCVHSFDGVAALEARAQLDRLALPLPIHLTVWDSKTGRWSLPDRFGFYSEMLIAVQLANRRHSLGEIDASRFIAAVQQIAVSIDADFDPPDVTRLVFQAVELDRLCARFDVQITLTLEALVESWSNAEVAAAATEAGLNEVERERWERVDAQHPTALSMTPAASFPTQRLTLTLDVPGSTSNPSPLSMLFAVAHQVAARLNARVVDDNGKTVEPGAQSAIEGELEKLVSDMRAAGIEPGSMRARRLYTE